MHADSFEAGLSGPHGLLAGNKPSEAGVEPVRSSTESLLASRCMRCCQKTGHRHQEGEPLLSCIQLNSHSWHKPSGINFGHALQGTKPPKVDSAYSEDERREPFRELLRGALPDQDASTNEEVASLSGTQLRDRLIAHKPLDRDWIAQVNQVIAAIPDLV